MKLNTLAAALALTLVVTPALAAKHGDPGAGKAQYSPRGQLVYDIVMRWGPHVQEAYQVNPRQWVDTMAPQFKGASLDQLRQAADADTFEEMNDVLLGKLAPSGAQAPVAPQLLGDDEGDLVYTPVAPCRLLDTRLAGGQITGGTERDFDVTDIPSNYAGQGGSSTDCGVGNLGQITAVVLNLTVVNPTSAAPSFLTAYPNDGSARPLAATMAYSGGNLVSSTAIVPIDHDLAGNELTIYLNGTAHVVADIVGYFDEPEATALECIHTAKGASLVFDSTNRTGAVIAPNCPAGYTRVSFDADATGDFNNLNSTIVGDYYNYFHYYGSTSATAYAYSNCCRVPGK